MQKITPFLWFDDQAEEAAKFYTSIFKNSKLMRTARYGKASSNASGRPPGSVMTVQFQIEGMELVALNGGPIFKFTPAISMFVACESEKEVESLWARLSEGGKAYMPLQRYPFADKYGWCEDRFGFSWQLIYSAGRPARKRKISPALLFVGKQYGKTEEAIQYYSSVFPDSRIEMIARDEKTHAVLHARFQLAGQDFVAMEPANQEHKHEFSFSTATSFVVNCETQQEIDSYWKKLSDGGSEVECGWLTDRFGVAWQVTPTIVGEMASDPDPERSERVMQAVLKMKKLELEVLKKAYEGR